MHLTPHCKESALPFCKIQTTDQRTESRKGAGRKLGKHGGRGMKTKERTVSTGMGNVLLSF